MRRIGVDMARGGLGPASGLTFDDSGTVISLIALFVALGGTAYAVTSLPKNSVGSPQVINGSLQTADLSNKTIAALKGKPGPAGAVGQAGPAGATGPAGAQGATGPAGPADLSKFGRIYLAGSGDVRGPRFVRGGLVRTFSLTGRMRFDVWLCPHSSQRTTRSYALRFGQGCSRGRGRAAT